MQSLTPVAGNMPPNPRKPSLPVGLQVPLLLNLLPGAEVQIPMHNISEMRIVFIVEVSGAVAVWSEGSQIQD